MVRFCGEVLAGVALFILSALALRNGLLRDVDRSVIRFVSHPIGAASPAQPPHTIGTAPPARSPINATPPAQHTYSVASPARLRTGIVPPAPPSPSTATPPAQHTPPLPPPAQRPVSAASPDRRPTSIVPAGRRAALLSVAIGVASPGRANHESYCSKWKYDYLLIDKKIEDELSPNWQKLPATLNALRSGKYDYIFWIDSDAVITNCQTSLESLMARMEREKSTWLFSGDSNIINTGQMMWKNTDQALAILTGVRKLWYPRFDREQANMDNGAFAAYLTGARRPDRQQLTQAYSRADGCYVKHRASLCAWVRGGDRKALREAGVGDELARQITFVSQRTINSYSGSYQPGDFVFHCAGPGNKVKCIENFWQKWRGKRVCDASL